MQTNIHPNSNGIKERIHQLYNTSNNCLKQEMKHVSLTYIKGASKYFGENSNKDHISKMHPTVEINKNADVR